MMINETTLFRSYKEKMTNSKLTQMRLYPDSLLKDQDLYRFGIFRIKNLNSAHQ